MLKKILIISPTPTHPTNAGNRQVILSLARSLKQEGFDLYFLLLEYESGDRQAMEKWWNDKIFYFDRSKLFGKKNFSQKVYLKIAGLVTKCKKRIGLISGKYSPNESRYNNFIDAYYPAGLNKYIKKIQAKNQFDAVITEYVFLSRAFLAFEKKIPKVLDTLDIFSDRYKNFLEIGQEPSWISLFSAEEKKGFNRADIILSLQQNEINFIKNLGIKKKILQIGHTLNYDPVLSRNNNTLLFVASHNTMNIDAINDFIANVFPIIKTKVPQCKLLIAGNISTVRDQVFVKEDVEFLGQFTDIKDAYAKGYILICPLRAGTGIKVKLLEALSYGKPCVVTPAAADGLENFAGKYFLVGKNYAEQAEQIVSLFSDSDKYNSISASLKEFCNEYNQSSQLNELYVFLKSGKQNN